MSILIKGMEMPKEGEYYMTLYVCSDGSAYIDVDAFPLDTDKFEAVSIPPHGDLVDRSKIEYTFQMQGGVLMTSNKIIGRLPTIIPAEEAHNGQADL